MRKASTVSIGDEIISGQTVDTNASYLARELLSVGIPVVSFYAVGDDIGAIVRILGLASSDADIVLITGGLGPTDDDVTREAFARFLGTELEFRNGLLEKIEVFFAMRGRQMPQNCRRQAYIPAGAEPIANRLGTAPGIMARAKGKLLVVLPGVPDEMKQMFQDSVLAQAGEFAGDQAIEVRKLRCFGKAESEIAALLGDLMRRGRNPLINCTVEQGVITVYVIATAKDKLEAQKLAEKDEKMLRGALGELVYGTEEQTLADVVGESLARHNKTIAVAESCTGGYLAKLLTDTPGASRYFTYGWVVYSNAAKTTELGIAAGLIEKYGAVSSQVAEAMAQSARKKASTDFAIGITGIAGPTGASEQKPVGLVYISVDSVSGCETKRFVFSHDRKSVRIRAAQTALNMLRLKFYP
jgi:nicotinamide-nucleotide amidase